MTIRFQPQTYKYTNESNINPSQTKSVLGVYDKSVPLSELAHYSPPQKYISRKEITQLAIDKYRASGNGINFSNVMNAFNVKKEKARRSLRYFHGRAVLFTPKYLVSQGLYLIKNKNPQQYYPTCIKGEILENKNKQSVHINPTGVNSAFLPVKSCASPLSQCFQYIAIQTLEGYVLPLLSEAPLFIHNMHFKTKIPSDYYEVLKLPCHKRNNGKYRQEIIGRTLVEYIIYKSGTVDIHTTCSNNPYKLETEEDRFRIIEFFGQIRAGLIALLYDKHERIVPDVLEWQLTECDINKDIKVSDLLHFSAIKIQVKHLDHIFRIYIKALEKDTVCRVEENKHPKRPAIEFINDIFNPIESIQTKLTKICDRLDKLTENAETRNKTGIPLLYSSKAELLKYGVKGQGKDWEVG